MLLLDPMHLLELTRLRSLLAASFLFLCGIPPAAAVTCDVAVLKTYFDTRLDPISSNQHPIRAIDLDAITDANGTFLFVATGQGLAIYEVDVANSTAPLPGSGIGDERLMPPYGIGRLDGQQDDTEDPSLSLALTPDGNTLVQGWRIGVMGLKVVDVANRANPTQMINYLNTGPLSKVRTFARGGVNYVVGKESATLHIFELQGSFYPVQRGVVAAGGNDFAVGDPYIYVAASSGLRIFNIQTMALPGEITLYPSVAFGNYRGVARDAVTGYVYVSTVYGDLEVWDVSALPVVTRVATYSAAVAVTASRLQANYPFVYVSGSCTGFEVLDVSALPVIESVYAAPGTCVLGALSDLRLLPDPRGGKFYRAAHDLLGSYTLDCVIPVPAAPSALGATATSQTSVDLTWSDNSVDETGFAIERSNAGASGPFALVGNASADSVAYTDTSAAASQSYWYRVAATNGGGASPYSNSAFVSTAPPAAPSGLAATLPTTTSVDLTWNDLSNTETSFVVERGSAASGPFGEIGTTAADATNFNDATVGPDMTYFYRVKAVGVLGSSLYSNLASAGTGPALPAAPALTSAVAVCATRNELTWDDNSVNESGFLVERAGIDGIYTAIATALADSVFYADISGISGTPYTYRLAATNGAGVSPYCPALAATPLGAPYYGDLDEDTNINASDAVILSNYSVGNLSPGSLPFTAPIAAADLNSDNAVNAVDGVILANYLVGNLACIRQ